MKSKDIHNNRQTELFPEIVPIPFLDDYFLKVEGKTRLEFANEYMKELRQWIKNNPKRNWREIVATSWIKYAESNL